MMETKNVLRASAHQRKIQIKTIKDPYWIEQSQAKPSHGEAE